MTTATVKPTNYSASQEAILIAAAVANNRVADKALAESLATDSRMNTEDGKARTGRAIIAKLRNLSAVEANGFKYVRQQPTTKDGKAVTKKTDLVARIARMADVSADKLDGLDKAPKGALEVIAAAFAAMDSEAA